MGKRGAPKGNNNAAKAKVWQSAINRALDKRSRIKGIEAIEELAEVFLDKCAEGDMTALKELGDRLEGKVSQAVILEGDEDKPLVTVIRREIIDAHD